MLRSQSDGVKLEWSSTLVDNDDETGLTYKVHIEIDQDGIDHILPVISDAHDAVTKA